MSLQFCLGCTAAYSVGAPACPQCGSTKYTDTPPSERAEPAAEVEAPAVPKRRSKPTPPPDEPAEAPAS